MACMLIHFQLIVIIKTDGHLGSWLTELEYWVIFFPLKLYTNVNIKQKVKILFLEY